MSSLAEDGVALDSAASAAEEALQLEREALSVLRDSWSGESAAAATDFIDSHCREGEAVVSALRRAAAVLISLGDSVDGLGDPLAGVEGQFDAGLADRSPSNFPAPVPPPAAAPAPAMNWPGSGMPALPDIGGAIADLIAEAADSLNADPGATDTPPEDPPAEDPPVEAVDPAAPDPAPEAAAAQVAVPAEPAPPLAAEVPTAESVPPVPVEATEPVEPPAQPADSDRTPCEIAADELPQVGQ